MTVCEPLELLPWDTEFFGVVVARITARRLRPEASAATDAWCRERRVRCLYFQADPDDDETVRVAESDGFHLVDVRMEFLWKRPAAGTLACTPIARGEARYRSDGDTDGIVAIAGDAYRQTRFYFDRRFPEERAAALYREWARKSCGGWANSVLVVPHGGAVGGFVTCHSEGPSRGRIGLVGVRTEARGAGIGTLVVRAAQEYFAGTGAGEVLVATQARNLDAQRLYQKCGFLTHSVSLTYHKWFDR